MMQGRRLTVQLLNQAEQAGSYSNLLLDHALHQTEMEQKEKKKKKNFVQPCFMVS
jgi:hypothetical protein